MNKKLILSIDFDNTIANVKKFPKIHSLRKGAKKYINRLYEDGYFIIINTCRTDVDENNKHQTDAENFLIQKGIKYDICNKNMPHLSKVFKSDSRKISADIYIDDKGLWLFGLPSWFFLYWMIRFKSKFIKKNLLSYSLKEVFEK